MIASAARAVAQSDLTSIVLAVLNVVQTLWLADIAARSRRVRSVDHRQQPRRRAPVQRQPRDQP